MVDTHVRAHMSSNDRVKTSDRMTEVVVVTAHSELGIYWIPDRYIHPFLCLWSSAVP